MIARMQKFTKINTNRKKKTPVAKQLKRGFGGADEGIATESNDIENSSKLSNDKQ